MKLLHTSDWHIGRSFHGHSTLDALRSVLAALVEAVREQRIDVVLVAGDVFDSAMPAAEHFTLLTDTLLALRSAGASVVVTSGNHDSAARLGFQSGFLGASGVHVITRPESYVEPIVLADEHGEVAVYGIPYLEPSLFRHRHPGVPLRSHDEVLGFAMEAIRADASVRGTRAVVLSHCFAVGVPAAEAPRDITAGGIDYVALERFDGPDYVALGHLHGRAILSEAVRYSGAPLHYSFGEAGKPRGAWIVELDASGLAGVEWLELPVPRPLHVLTGTIDELLQDPSYTPFENDWVSAILTDRLRPHDPMPRLQQRFPGCTTLVHLPEGRESASGAVDAGYASRVRGRTELEVVEEFLSHVRAGAGASAGERELLVTALGELDAEAGR